MVQCNGPVAWIQGAWAASVAGGATSLSWTNRQGLHSMASRLSRRSACLLLPKPLHKERRRHRDVFARPTALAGKFVEV